jgi:ribose 5-phosphate isomerase A
MAKEFVCIVDASKRVPVLGQFPLPVEVIPMAAPMLIRRFAQLGGQAAIRLKDGQPLLTDNGQHILDVKGLQITHPLAFEDQVSQWPGVVTVGVFAHQKAQVCLLGTPSGVETLRY